MITYIKDMKALLTCDVFGGFGIPPTLYDENRDVIGWYEPLIKKYVVNIIGHYRNFIISNIDKIRKLNLDVRIIAPAHGLIWRNNPEMIINYYYELAKAEVVSDKIVIVYSSMYGFVEKAANILRKHISSYGLRVITFKFTDDKQSELSDILSEVYDSRALILGVSTYEADVFPKLEYVIKMLIHKVNIEKPLIVLVTYGWGPVAIKKITELLKNSKFRIIDVISIRGRVKDEDISKINEALRKVLSF